MTLNFSPRSGSTADLRSRKCPCEWPDSNRHGVTHWYLKPVGIDEDCRVRVHPATVENLNSNNVRGG